MVLCYFSLFKKSRDLLKDDSKIIGCCIQELTVSYSGSGHTLNAYNVANAISSGKPYCPSLIPMLICLGEVPAGHSGGP